MTQPRPSLESLGDAALLARFGTAIDAAVNARVQLWFRRLLTGRPSWLQDVVPAYATLAVFVDIAEESLGDDPLDAARAWLEERFAEGEDGDAEQPARAIEIPVCYGGAFGADLEDSARELGISPDELIARHAAATYRVAMIGFAPGFPYLLGMDPAIALPRLATPRTRVPAGSVGIGGAQTGIYPKESPGGWRILGRTPLVLFDETRDPPALLAPGDAVRFVPIGGEAFAASRAS